MAINKTNVNIFLRAETAEQLVELQLVNNAVNGLHYNYQTPVYVYSENKLLEAADNFLSFPSAF